MRKGLIKKKINYFNDKAAKVLTRVESDSRSDRGKMCLFLNLWVVPKHGCLQPECHECD